MRKQLGSFYPVLGWIALITITMSGCHGESDQPKEFSPEASQRTSDTETPVPVDLTVSDSTSPWVGYRIEGHDGPELTFTILVEEGQAGWPQPRVNLGVAGGKTITRHTDQANVTKEGTRYSFAFKVKRFELGATNDPINNLRWAFDVAWLNSANDPIQKENFLVDEPWASFRPIGKNPSAWSPFNLQEYAATLEHLAQEIRITWRQPFKGKASVVVENADGRRVRNLVSGQEFNAGSQSVVWDGLDEAGNIVPPGRYQWRTIMHRGINPHFVMSFYNPGQPGWGNEPSSRWLADHSSPSAAASNGQLIALASPIAESGNNIVILDQEGNKLNHARLPSHVGGGRLFVAMDEQRLYALTEGRQHYGKRQTASDGSSYYPGSLNLFAWNLKDGKQHRFKGTRGDKVLRRYQVPVTHRSKLGGVTNLRGVAYIKPNLYLSLHDENRILLIDPQTGAEKGSLPLSAPGALATDGTRLLAYSGDKLFLYDQPAPNATGSKLFSPPLSQPLSYYPKGVNRSPSLAFSRNGHIYTTDPGKDQNVKVYDLEGKELATIGQAGGGTSEGVWEPRAMRLPSGLALDDRDQLWVAEAHHAPKRISVWDGSSGRLQRDFLGPAHYGASGAGFDTTDASRWIGGGALWNLDLNRHEAQIEAVLFDSWKPGRPSYRFRPFSCWFVHQDGRTFIVTKDIVMRLYELKANKRAKLWAMWGPLSGFLSEHPRWWIPESFTRHPKLQEILADFTEEAGPYGNFRNAPKTIKGGRKLAVLWIDQDGNDLAEIEEIQVTGDKDHELRSSIWGYQFGNSLDLRLYVKVQGRPGTGTMKLQGWLPSGAPDWKLSEAVLGAQVIQDLEFSMYPEAFGTDSQGRLLASGNPMAGIDPSGELTWTFPSNWRGVHGSHRAPLPETGVLQGVLSYLGLAPLDEKGDVFIMNGNHGRFFAMTSDGMYLDELFVDVRLSRDSSAYRIGGEPFGGYFGRDEKSGRYYLQSGHSDYRIFEIKGLDDVQRSDGWIEVKAEQILAAQRLKEKALAQTSGSRLSEITALDGNTTQPPIVAEWGDASKPFPHAQVRAAIEDKDLVLQFQVKDPSPWMNQGTEQQLLFKTGDAVVFEFSTDPSAPIGRTQPVAGDKRLLMAPFEDGVTAVLYDYVVPGTLDPTSFHSPWRAVTVDQVRVLEAANIEVKRKRNLYELTARLPLSELGLPSDGRRRELLGDFGVIYGDEKGRINILRSFWNNPSTGLVNDVPGETTINPSLWGTLIWN